MYKVCLALDPKTEFMFEASSWTGALYQARKLSSYLHHKMKKVPREGLFVPIINGKMNIYAWPKVVIY